VPGSCDRSDCVDDDSYSSPPESSPDILRVIDNQVDVRLAMVKATAEAYRAMDKATLIAAVKALVPKCESYRRYLVGMPAPDGELIHIVVPELLARLAAVPMVAPAPPRVYDINKFPGEG